MIRILDRENDTLLNKFIAQMRDVGVQGDSMRFRRNLERTGEVMAYEISKTLHYSMRTVETPLGEAEVALPDDQIVIATILRAGLPFHQGFLNYFDDAFRPIESTAKTAASVFMSSISRRASCRARRCCWSIRCWPPARRWR